MIDSSHDLSHFTTGTIDASVTKHFKLYFDAPANFGPGLSNNLVSLMTAGFHYDRNSSSLDFKISDLRTNQTVKVKSISDKYDIFPIGNNRYMIRQPTYIACSYACEEMLLVQGKNKAEAKVQIEEAFNKIRDSEGRSPVEVLQSINSRIAPGEKPYQLYRSYGDDYSEVFKLEKLINKADGPVFFSTNGHARIIDGLLPESIFPGSENIKFFVALRDPFTSNCVLTVGRDIFRSANAQMFSIVPGESEWEIIYREK